MRSAKAVSKFIRVGRLLEITAGLERVTAGLERVKHSSLWHSISIDSPKVLCIVSVSRKVTLTPLSLAVYSLFPCISNPLEGREVESEWGKGAVLIMQGRTTTFFGDIPSEKTLYKNLYTKNYNQHYISIYS